GHSPGGTGPDVALLLMGSLDDAIPTAPRVVVLASSATGELGAVGSLQVPGIVPGRGYLEPKLVAADLDGDGDADLAITGGQYSPVAVLENRGDGVMALSGLFNRGSEDFKNRYFLAAGDLDGDGDVDL